MAVSLVQPVGSEAPDHPCVGSGRDAKNSKSLPGSNLEKAAESSPIRGLTGGRAGTCNFYAFNAIQRTQYCNRLAVPAPSLVYYGRRVSVQIKPGSDAWRRA
jgi:hypothetical protein